MLSALPLFHVTGMQSGRTRRSSVGQPLSCCCAGAAMPLGARSRQNGPGQLFLHDGSPEADNQRVGYQVWPTEVESMTYYHPTIQEVGMITARDTHRDETVKAFVVHIARHVETVPEDDVITWARANMAAYKVPRIVEIVDSLPESCTGKSM
ncbi:AMP-binding enzyme [Paraburkholderia bryophila]|uniref:AMP-binding enzyme n=1 Tax=Paraburkholderia bryophila TaxID=420952 RepID=UPI00300DCC2A